MKLLCAIAFALLPLAASAQTLNSSLLTGLVRGEAVFEADDVSITGPSAAHKPAVAAGAAEE